LTSLLKKGVTFLWTDECTQALERLKKIVTLETVLVPPDQDRQFILEVDASQFATGTILYQADRKMTDHKGNPILRPCGYHSQMFFTTEQHYPIYDREFLAVIRGLKHWDYLLKCAKHLVLVIMDHANLTYYHHPHKIGQRVAGYIAEYEQYDIQLAYRPGMSNQADALLRQPDYAPDPYNNELVIALPEHLFIPPNTPVIRLQTRPFRARTLCLNAAGITNNNNDNPGINSGFIQINSIQDDNLNTDIETDIIHLQSIAKNRLTLESWRAQFNIEHRPGDLW
jgi:hypothetical protein